MLNYFGGNTQQSPYVLNNVKGAVAAYALRRLRNTATNAIRVRRSYDNAEQDIGFVGKDLDVGRLSSFTAPISYSNFVSNGNFSNGTTGWITSGASVSATSNTLSITGTGTDATPRASQNIGVVVASKKIFVRALMRVTNANCTSININITPDGTGSDINASSQASPVQNQWYILQGVITEGSNWTGNVLLRLRHNYADAATANGKVMEVKEVMAIDLTTLFGAGNEPTAAQCDSLFPFTATSSTTAAQSAYVAKWYDQSGNSNDAVQTTAANQPRIVNAGVVDVDAKGKPTVYFNGSHWLHTNTTSISFGSGKSILSVASTLTSGVIVGDSTVIPSTAPTSYNPLLYIGTDNKLRGGTYNGSGTPVNMFASTQSVNTGALFEASYISSNSSQNIYLNGVGLGSKTSVTGSLAIMSLGTGFTGSWASGNQSWFYLNGYISETIVYNYALIDVDRAKLERNQGRYYNITVS